MGQEDLRYDAGLSKKGVPGTAFDTRAKNYVFTRGPLPAAAPVGVEYVSEPIKAFAKRLREKKGKDIWTVSSLF